MLKGRQGIALGNQPFLRTRVPTDPKRVQGKSIPADWEVWRIGELFDVSAGGDFDPKSSSDQIDHAHRYPVYANGLSGEGLHAYSSCATARPGSITVTARGTLGRAFFRTTPFAAIGRLLVLEPKVAMDARFFSYFINFAVNFAVESTGVPQLTAPQVARYSLAVPPATEQHAIAEALSDFDGLLKAFVKLIEKKQAVKQAVMQQLLTGELRLPGFRRDWTTVRLGSASEMSSGGTPSSNVASYFGGEFPWVSISDMTRGERIITRTERTLSRAGYASSAARMFPAGTVLYAMYASIGECSLAGVPLCSSQAILGIQPGGQLDNDFLYYWLTNEKDRIKSLAQHGTQANLNLGMVKNLNIPLPELAEQRAIARVLLDMDADIAALERRHDKTDAIKQGVMQQLLTGRIRLVETN